MAIYRQIQMTFWTDTKVVDEFTPEDKYFYLYLFTNPHTNLAGCYEISMKQMSIETGYSTDTLERLIERMSVTHKVVSYDKQTKEILLLNWHKYNWTSSEKFRVPLLKEIESVKNADFRGFLLGVYNNSDTVSIPYAYGMDTTVTVTVNNNTLDNINNVKGNNKNILNNNIYNINHFKSAQSKIESDLEKIPLSDGTEWTASEEEYKEYSRLFPDVNIETEFRKMRSWCNANTKKTRRGIKRFVNAWLSRAQDGIRGRSTKTLEDKFKAIERWAESE